MENREQRIQRLRAKAMKLPLLPGVYIMHDSTGKIIYIGKAKALKNRVSQYFGSEKNHDNKVRRMVASVEDFEYIITDSEFEALVLECSLIKQHTPKYNILLKDDKGYHYIRITKGDWPRISQAKQLLNDGAEYLGPYVSSWATKESVDEALRIFKLPTCSRSFPRDIGKGRPCLQFFIDQCCAPCGRKITQPEYKELAREAEEFLRSGGGVNMQELTRQMNEAAENLEFEKAARLRDRLSALKKIAEKQKVVAVKYPEQDIIAFAQGSGTSCFEVFRFQNGRLCDRETFLMGDVGDPSSARTEFIERYYSMRERIPLRVCLDAPASDMELLSQWLSEKAGRKITMFLPQKGEQARLVEMCRSNAAEHVAQAVGRTMHETAALDELARLLGLDHPPGRIESYDISNLAGGENVAGMVVFENGRPSKKDYRKFRIKTVQGQDDYGSMREVIFRRLEEFQKAKTAEGFGVLPDLILLDGGKGQVSAVRPVLEAKGYDIPLFGMVKDDKHRTRAITAEGGEISITSSRSAFTLVSSLQEEVHRFAIGYHRQLRKKNTIHSSLLEIPGIGTTRAKALLKSFRTVQAIRNADLEELAGAPGMNRPAAEAVYRHYHPEEAPNREPESGGEPFTG